MKKKRVFDRTGGPEAFRRMARTGGPVKLSHAKGSVQEAARELGIDSSRITKWRQNHKNFSQLATPAVGLSEEQKLIKRLQKELKEAQLERDIPQQSASSPGETAAADRGNFPIYSGTRQSVSHGPPLRLRRCAKC
ncbi:transposase [Fibrella forsythiae]|uniref:Transposase n=1 Tax=Fibrella forsythiae TaxID=2817061 RepID=A0ABS3JQ03_9BACT|nr:transposase [Fibrella forsythiae]MBO0951299.1 transposase [Fibrella forsythiae]